MSLLQDLVLKPVYLAPGARFAKKRVCYRIES